MATNETITLYYSPQTRATGARVLLEELGAPYELHVLNMKIDEQRHPDYLAINPMGKVPAIRHGKALVTEQAGVGLYLGDLFPEAGLTPAIGDPDRGAYVRWMVFYGSCFEPALAEHVLKREPAHRNFTPYGRYEEVLDILEQALSTGPYLLGERMTVVDILWGLALQWTMMFGIVAERPAFRRYADLLASRESFRRITAEDIAMAAEHQAIADRLGVSAA